MTNFWRKKDREFFTKATASQSVWSHLSAKGKLNEKWSRRLEAVIVCAVFVSYFNQNCIGTSETKYNIEEPLDL